jgi:hypothetical protein
LLKNRNVVEKGACISISNGHLVDVWKSPWIPSMGNFRPVPNVNLVELPNFSVEDLILQGERVWNKDLLEDLFDPISVKCILSIHLPVCPSFDKWIWAPASSGLFSVKSAHELEILVGGRISPLSSDSWVSLWGLKLQARLKHLLWKVAWNILPSRDNIGRFVVSNDPNAWVCPFCKGPIETLSHIFLECELATSLWSLSPWPNVLGGFVSRPISDWILALLSPVVVLGVTKNEVRKFQLFASLVLDFIWRARNLLIHEGTVFSAGQAFFQVSRTLNFHVDAWKSCILPSLWAPPAVGWFKANFDVAVTHSFAVAAAVLSDDSGNIIAAASQKLVSRDVLQGEAAAALLAVRLAVFSGCEQLLLEGDALLIVLAINNPSLFSSWCFAHCISDISLVLSSLHSWLASKVSRCANFRAHALAK